MKYCELHAAPRRVPFLPDWQQPSSVAQDLLCGPLASLSVAIMSLWTRHCLLYPCFYLINVHLFNFRPDVLVLGAVLLAEIASMFQEWLMCEHVLKWPCMEEPRCPTQAPLHCASARLCSMEESLCKFWRSESIVLLCHHLPRCCHYIDERQ